MSQFYLETAVELVELLMASIEADFPLTHLEPDGPELNNVFDNMIIKVNTWV